uniref:dehydrogenase/reductase SDR family member 12-like n=1 Tax=Ciona intestinalis TaxID=7719 RepID=UPI000052398A|nr:dehydrogenase/reductase SDR family member 12-like [Ciona intestinalis]|eukprot:XP_002132114.1 dehydrogenase/reductase SDR family member 12-like [Ciona intestinalis]
MSIYQKTAFFIKGRLQFTNGGYAKAAKSFHPEDTKKDVSDQVFMVTGANSGLGKAAAIAIAKNGGEVHMVCRNLERANQAKEDIVKESGNSNITVHVLDISNTKEVYEFAKNFSSNHEKLNVLVNNAGCMVNDRKTTEVGNLELNFATNTVGTYVLTQELVPLLLKSTKPRVITVSSGGMYTQKLNVKDLQSEKGTFSGDMAYAQQKRQQVILTEEWAKMHPDIHFSAMHPGWADTPAVRTSMPGFYEYMKDNLRTAEQGADTIVWLSVSDAALAQPSGLFFLDRKAVPTHLALAWTRESAEDRNTFLTKIAEIANQFKP